MKAKVVDELLAKPFSNWIGAELERPESHPEDVIFKKQKPKTKKKPRVKK